MQYIVFGVLPWSDGGMVAVTRSGYCCETPDRHDELVVVFEYFANIWDLISPPHI